MRLLLICFALFMSSVGFSSPLVKTPASVKKVHATKASLKSFLEWKNDKIHAASSQVENSKADLRAVKTRAAGAKGYASAVRSAEQQVTQERWNLEVAQDLTVTDYIVLYLAHQGSPGKFNEAASKLTPEQTAQVLEAYIRSMGAFPASDSKKSLPDSAVLTH